MWWHTVTHVGGSEGGNWRMQWVASTLHTTSGHGVPCITTADAHNSAVSNRLNWHAPYRFKWTRPYRRKTKPGFCACAITFQLASIRFLHYVSKLFGNLRVTSMWNALQSSFNMTCRFRLCQQETWQSFTLPWLHATRDWMISFLTHFFAPQSVCNHASHSFCLSSLIQKSTHEFVAMLKKQLIHLI